MAQVAFHTFNVLRAPRGDPQMEDFVDRLRPVFAAADRAPGCLLMLRTRDGVDYPRFREPGRYPGGPVTLFVSTDLESVAAFADGAAHAEALRHRREWFVKAK
jgi:hypothetical protein